MPIVEAGEFPVKSAESVPSGRELLPGKWFWQRNTGRQEAWQELERDRYG